MQFVESTFSSLPYSQPRRPCACALSWCHRTKVDATISLPRSPATREAWLYHLRPPGSDFSSQYVCLHHFPEGSLEKVVYGRIGDIDEGRPIVTLKKDALPTVNAEEHVRRAGQAVGEVTALRHALKDALMMLAYLDNQSLTGTGNGSRKRARHGSSSSGAREDSPHGGNNPFNDYFGLRVCPTNGIGPPLLPYGGSIGSVERVGIAASASQGGPAVVPPPPVSSFSGQHSPTIDVSLPGPSPAMATGRRRDTPGGQTEEQDRPTDRGTVSPKSKGVHVEVPGVSAAMSLPFPVTFGTFDPTRGDHVLRRPPFTTECSYPGCSGRLEYDGEGNVSGTFCPRHRSNNLVSENLYCKEPGCKKPPRDRAEIKEDRYSGGLQSQTTCLHEGCSRMSRFSLRGKEKSVGYFCSMHKLKGMVNVRHRLCNQEGCNVIPSFGFESEGSKPRFCAYHKLKGMVDVRNPRCQHKDCNRVPSYGFKGGKRTFCSTHKQDDMVNLVQAHCKEAGCQRKPVYGQVWLKRPNLCEVHWANATVLPLAKKGWAPPPTVLTQGVSTDSATSATAPPITNTTSPAQANGQIVGNTAGASELKGDMPQKRDTEGLVK